MYASNHVCRLLSAIGFCLTTTLAQAAGLREIDIPADADGPAMHGAIWSPCAEPPGEIRLNIFILPGVKDCPLLGEKLPLVVVSHGGGGNFFVGSHDTAETLADNGFVVAAINHPGDTGEDLSRADDLSVYVERPQDIKRLIDFMLVASPFGAAIDRERIGFFGPSRGGYTGLVLIGANPDWAKATHICQHCAAQIARKEYPAEPLTHDPRIKAAVIADPPAVVFTAGSLAAVKMPVQLWASEYGGEGVLPHDIAAMEANRPAKHEYRVVPNSWHLSFLPPCAAALIKEFPEFCVDTPGFDRVAFHKEFNAAVLGFFQQQLR
jgi:predicted dienelactone hydrolase